MNLARKLRDWTAAGIIDAATAERIAAFEQREPRPVLLYALGGLGAFTIGLGTVSVVAANWNGIPPRVKLAADLLLAGLVGAATFRSVRRERPWAAETLVAFYYLFTLASFGLVGQVYQSHAPLHRVLLLWSAATLPLMLLARSRFVGFLWCLGLAVSGITGVAAGLDRLEHVYGVGDETLLNLVVSIGFTAPLLVAAAGQAAATCADRRQVGLAFAGVGWTTTFAGGLLLPLLWYASTESARLLTWAVIVAAAVSVAFVSGAMRCGWLSAAGSAALAVFLGLCVGSLGATTCVREAWPSIAALTQVLMLAALAFAAAQAGRMRVFNVLTALVGLRLLICYFEVFGSLMSTGLGMITGGALTLLVAWLWKRSSPALARRLGRAVE